MSIETDAQSYTGSPPAPVPCLQDVLEQRERDAAARVEAYRQALDHAARQGKLTEEYASELAAKPHMLGSASASWAAQALAVFARHLHSARKAAQSWNIGRSSEMIVLERLADEAAVKVQIDLVYLG